MSRRSQFVGLTRHFFERYFDRDSISSGADPRTNIIQMLSLLAVPGLMLSFLLVIKGDGTETSARYFYVSYSMVVMGFVMVFKWDSLFPDRRDYLILGSLPIRYLDLFLSKVAALCLFLGIFAIDINFFGALLLPGFDHLAGVFGGALFIALGFGTLQGVLINVLPPGLFRRVSPLFQMVSIAVLLTIFLIFPLIASSIRPLTERSSALMDYFPIFWFLGLYEYLSPNGNPNPVFGALALKAIYGLGLVIVGFVLTYALAYRRQSRSVLEVIDTGGGRGTRHSVVKRSVPVPVEYACFRFIGGILARSAKHQAFLAVYAGIGLALGLSSLFYVDPAAAFPFRISRDGMLALPLTLSFFAVSGLRATFNVPYELPANWIFRLTDSNDSSKYIAATRKWVATYGIAPLMLGMAVVELGYWPWRQALFHLVFELIVSLGLLQVLFYNFRKVPFTCSYYPGKTNLVFLAVAYLYGFTTYSASMVSLERWLMQSALRSAVFLVVGIVITCLLALRPAATGRLIYEEERPDALIGLGLN